MDFLGLELRELPVLIVIGLLIIGGVAKLILQVSKLSFKLDTFKDHAEKRMDSHETEMKVIRETHDRDMKVMREDMKEHRREFTEFMKEHRREFTELLKEIRDNREEMRLALQRK